MKRQYDIIIVGGGLVGLSLAYGLDQLGYKTALIEARELKPMTANFDSRAIALAWSSVEILKSLGIWSTLDEQACPIEQIHISEKGGFGFSRLRASDTNTPQLGHIIEIAHLANQLLENVPESIDLLMPASVQAVNGKTITIEQSGRPQELTAKLIIAADGANSSLRKLLKVTSQTKDYEQTAVVGNLALKRSHHNIAYERFTESGPMALLPLKGNRATFVWVLKRAQAEAMKGLSDADFRRAFQSEFGYRVGRIEGLSARNDYPLKQVLSDEQYTQGVLFLGNAVHSLHPVAGQGFNLCLRDIALLLEAIADHAFNDQDSPDEAIEHYLQMSQGDQKRTQKITNALVDCFDLDAIKPLRKLGLRTFQRLGPVKRLFAEQMTGRLGRVSKLARGKRL